MQGEGPRGIYYRALDQVARFVQDVGPNPRRRLVWLLSVAGALLGVSWAAANMLVMQAGELPGTPAYDRVLYSYLMRLLCGEFLIVGAVLLSTVWAQQAGRIPTYPVTDEGE